MITQAHIERALDLAATVGATAADIVRLNLADNGDLASIELLPISGGLDDTFGRFILNFSL